MLKKIYLGPLGLLISIVMNAYSRLIRPYMVYGYFDFKKFKYLKYTRISSSATIIGKKNLTISNHCWVWHHSIIDASHGVEIGEGTQIGAFVGIFTHSSHIAIRLYGRAFINYDSEERLGYVRNKVIIGKYTFVGAGALILPGATIGDGCVVAAGAVVKGNIPDYSIVIGNPGKIVGMVDRLDSTFISEPVVQKNYFDKDLLNKISRSDE
ncbi:MAG: acyltransferase [Thalassolituus sp.]|uniref:acyltransferase n=1 Tax=Thalassolituus sp. TaxID=2030822 RepID=UPI003982A235